MRIAACDDDKLCLEYLDSLFKEYKNSKPNYKKYIEITYYDNLKTFLFDNNESYPYDLIFLDIEMNDEINGIDLAKRIREKDKDVPIVFITGISDYVFEGYEVNAYRYLMKPINKDKLFEIIDYFYVSPIINKYFFFEYDKDTIKCEYNDIIYIEAMGHYINIKTINKEYQIKSPFNEICKELNDKRFIKCHRSYLVNLVYVQKISKEFLFLTNKEAIPIARNSYDDVNKHSLNFI